MTDEELRIRSYLQAQGAKLAPAEIIDKVRVAMAQLRAAAESVPAARFAQRPADDEWSGNEVMAHVVESGRHFGDAIVRVLDGAAPGPGGVARREGARESHGTEPRTAAEWCTLLDRDRAALFERVLAADPAARLDETIDHGTFGALDWRATLLFLRLHDLDHAGQLGKLAAALAGSRPR